MWEKALMVMMMMMMMMMLLLLLVWKGGYKSHDKDKRSSKR